MDFPCNEELLLNVLNASGRTTLDLHGIGLIMQTAGLDDPNTTYGGADYTIMPARDNFQMPPRMTSARNAEILSLQLANIGVDVRTNTAAKELVVEGGEVVGALVEGPDSVYEIRAKKVVLASGGFSQNREMIEQYAPRDATAATCANGGAYGDGIRMATEIGATVVGDRLDGNPCIGGNYSVYNDFYAKRVWEHSMRVNKDGQMWEDSHPLTGYTANIWEYVDLTAQPGGVAYCIFGSNNTYLDMFKNAQYADEVMTEAETLEDLADKIGVPADALLASVEEYNQIPAENMIATLANYYMAPAEDENVDFTIKDGPFYAFKIRATTCASVAGLKIDGECRVLDGTTGEPIPNLYAAGEVANGNLFQYYIGGWGIGGAMVTGHICGDNVKAAIRG